MQLEMMVNVELNMKCNVLTKDKHILFYASAIPMKLLTITEKAQDLIQNCIMQF